MASGPPSVHLLHNTIRDYAWGSRSALAELMGRPAPTPRPEAELWMGAHPGAPSRLRAGDGECGLDAWIARDPARVLGAGVGERFGGELPFLFKVVAPDEALSIQTHPGAAQAREGFERENAAGMAPDAPNRSYRDPHHKPEIVCALTPFEAMCGFRAVPEILEGLGGLALPELEPALASLRQAPDRHGLARFFEGVMTRAPAERSRLARQAAEAAGAALERATGGDTDACRCAVGLAEQYPGDPGVLAPFLLNLLELAPGEALFLPAGELHCYLRGVAVEAMANSDNVLRGGLTPKHVDVPELLRTLTFGTGAPPVLRPREVAPGEGVYDAPVAEFRLSVLHPTSGRSVPRRELGSAEIVLCTAGTARLVEESGASTALERGSSVFVSAGGHYVAEGDATLYRVDVPPA